jgi:hypothetical protein
MVVEGDNPEVEIESSVVDWSVKGGVLTLENTNDNGFFFCFLDCERGSRILVRTPKLEQVEAEDQTDLVIEGGFGVASIAASDQAHVEMVTKNISQNLEIEAEDQSSVFVQCEQAQQVAIVTSDQANAAVENSCAIDQFDNNGLTSPARLPAAPTAPGYPN